MGILDLMLGRTEPGEQGVDGQSYKLPKATHEFVYPVAVRRAELEAFEQIIDADAAESAFDAELEQLQAAVDEVVGEAAVDLEDVTASHQTTRERSQTVIDHWQTHLEDEVGVVYATEEVRSQLQSFLATAKRRHDDPDDGFELPADTDAAMALLRRLGTVTDDQYRAVVHTDLLPSS